MDKNKEKICFWAGTFLLYIAMMCLTILPKIALETITDTFVNVEHFRTGAMTLFLLALILYMMNKRSFKQQIAAIFACFAYYVVFLFYVI